MKYNTKHNQINKIFANWNPIGVPSDIAPDEYLDYILKTFNYKNDFLGLINYMESILTNDIGIDYNASNINDKKEILFFSYLIFKELQE